MNNTLAAACECGHLKKILVIEDDHDLRLTFKNMLRSQGYDVLDASDGNAGAAVYSTRPVDLVITDIFMPEKEGIEVVSELNRLYPQIKVIAVSGGGINGDLEYLYDTIEIGAHKIFEKPVDMDELLTSIQELLDVK